MLHLLALTCKLVWSHYTNYMLHLCMNWRQYPLDYNQGCPEWCISGAAFWNCPYVCRCGRCQKLNDVIRSRPLLVGVRTILSCKSSKQYTILLHLHTLAAGSDSKEQLSGLGTCAPIFSINNSKWWDKRCTVFNHIRPTPFSVTWAQHVFFFA